MYFLYVLATIFAVWLITHLIKSATSARIRAELEKEYQKKHKRLESEYAEKLADLEKREQKAAYHLEKEKSFSSRWQQLIDRERKVDERERLAEGLADRLVAERQREFDQKERRLHQIFEETVARGIDKKVTEAIGYKEDELAEREWIVTRRCHNLVKRQKKFVVCEQEMYRRAVLLSNYLGIPLKRILKPTEKKLVDKIANELPDERQALIDLVMSCPENQLKDLLASTQQFQRNLRR